MTRKKSHGVYNHARGDGWIVSTLGERRENERGVEPYVWEHVLYYIGSSDLEDCKVVTKEVSNPGRFLASYLDVGGRMGSYTPDVEPNTDVRDQPRHVRMARHAVDIYTELGHVRGMSPNIAMRAAEHFGSRWDETSTDDWLDVQSVGDGRAARFANELD